MIGLPIYHATGKQRRSVEGKRRTARFIRALWNVATKAQRNDPAFLCLLVQCGWWTGATCRWRNKNLARYLRVAYSSDDQLAADLHKHFSRLTLRKAAQLVRTPTGVTHYPNFYHSATLQFAKRHSREVGRAFEKVAHVVRPAHQKAFAVASVIEKLGTFRSRDNWLSPFNAITPALACLDPQRRFPIMNRRTARLLRQVEKEAAPEGVRELVRLIGTRGISDSFVLDAYALFEKFPPLPKRHKPAIATEYPELGIKSETESTAKINAKKTTITKLHNVLTNDFRDVLLWTQRIMPKEHRFDAVLEDWKNGRNLLVEAKTASEGPLGRMQIRQAIGQLFDYRFTYLSGKKVDMAVLLRKRPSEGVLELLASLRIECLWFEGKRLAGTIRLTPATV
jgi:hypothetical protein